MDTIGIANQSSHPHIHAEEGAYSLGQIVGITGPSYVIVHYPLGEGISVCSQIVSSHSLGPVVNIQYVAPL